VEGPFSIVNTVAVVVIINVFELPSSSVVIEEFTVLIID